MKDIKKQNGINHRFCCPNELSISVRAALVQLSLLAPLMLVSLPALADASPDGSDAERKVLDAVHVYGKAGYAVDSSRTATKTDTLLRDTPQSVTVVTSEQIEDQAVRSMEDAMRYVPGVGFAQGEGNRDTPIFRGNSSTADFYIDGIRDDVQYFRDVYNIDRIEVHKGPNAMIFGRGGSGGIINRVTKQAGWKNQNELALTVGSWDNLRMTGDFGNAPNDDVAFRVTGLYEDSDSYRNGVFVKRYGVNPTLSIHASDNSTLRFSLEHFKDQRVADRGVSSYFGGTRANPSRPIDSDPSTFFGNAELSPTWSRVNAFNALIDHHFGENISLRNTTRIADYSKFYQNVYPGAVSAGNTMVSISAYNNATERTNIFNQTDFTFYFLRGKVKHTLLAGAEFGRQDTENLRETGIFPADSCLGTGSNVYCVPLNTPRYNGTVTFSTSVSDANNEGVANIAALYLQDQIEFSPHWQAILGLRYDSFKVDLKNRTTGAEFGTDNGLLSPRIGLIYKPSTPISMYASYSIAHQPRSGEQLSSLNASNESLKPEQFKNREVGIKWDLDGLALTFAVYQLDRSNVAIAISPTETILVDAQRTQGIELGLSGNITDNWSVAGGYAWQDGEITEALSSTVPAGSTLAQTPKHSFSLWNKYEFNDSWSVGLGAIYRGDSFAATDNTVVLPGYTRFDAAVFFHASENLNFQLNIENLLDTEYFTNAHNNTNITPGSPRGVRLGVNYKF